MSLVPGGWVVAVVLAIERTYKKHIRYPSSLDISPPFTPRSPNPRPSVPHREPLLGACGIFCEERQQKQQDVSILQYMQTNINVCDKQILVWLHELIHSLSYLDLRSGNDIWRLNGQEGIAHKSIRFGLFAGMPHICHAMLSLSEHKLAALILEPSLYLGVGFNSETCLKTLISHI